VASVQRFDVPLAQADDGVAGCAEGHERGTSRGTAGATPRRSRPTAGDRHRPAVRAGARPAGRPAPVLTRTGEAITSLRRAFELRDPRGAGERQLSRPYYVHPRRARSGSSGAGTGGLRDAYPRNAAARVSLADCTPPSGGYGGRPRRGRRPCASNLVRHRYFRIVDAPGELSSWTRRGDCAGEVGGRAGRP